MRQQSNQFSLSHHTPKSIKSVEVQNSMKCSTDASKLFLHHPLHSVPILKHHLRVTNQFRPRYSIILGQGMTRSHQHLDRLIVEYLNQHFRGLSKIAVVHHHGYVHQTVFEDFQSSIAPQGSHPQLHVRIVVAKFLQHRRQISSANRVNCSHAQFRLLSRQQVSQFFSSISPTLTDFASVR